VLNVHGIGRPGRPLEPGEGRFWVGIDQFRAMMDMVADRPGARPYPTCITFDDGNASDIVHGAPELAARGLTAVFFPIAARIGQPGSLSAADLRALVAEGHRIGTHGQDHVDWRRLDAAGEAREYDAARAAIAAITGQAVTETAIPFGFYDRRVLAALGRRGFAAVYTEDKGLAPPQGWLRPRTSLRADMGAEELRAVLWGREGPLTRLRRLPGILAKRHLPARPRPT
jgi:peptidoglycan/xylan/chitin deacetylase (PgdA/CDA1 family)